MQSRTRLPGHPRASQFVPILAAPAKAGWGFFTAVRLEPVFIGNTCCSAGYETERPPSARSNANGSPCSRAVYMNLNVPHMDGQPHHSYQMDIVHRRPPRHPRTPRRARTIKSTKDRCCKRSTISRCCDWRGAGQRRRRRWLEPYVRNVVRRIGFGLAGVPCTSRCARHEVDCLPKTRHAREHRQHGVTMPLLVRQH